MPTDHERRMQPIARGFRWPLTFAQAAGVVASVPTTTIVVVLTDGLPAPVRFVLAVAASVAIGVGFFLLALGVRTRRALEAFAWIGERDVDRFIRDTKSAPPATAGAARRWLQKHPETPENLSHRVDVLVLTGELEQARATAERMPTETAWERFMRELQLDFVDRVAGSNEERAELRSAAAALELPDEQRHAAAYFGWAEADRVAIAGGDWRAPLAESRRQLGRDANGTLLRSRIVRQVAIVLTIVGSAVVLVQLYTW